LDIHHILLNIAVEKKRGLHRGEKNGN